MSRMRRAGLSALSVSLLASVAWAQEIRLPVGDSRVSGQVVAADTGAPLAGAEVVLQGVNLPPDLARRTTADAGGVFAFQDVPAREYRLLASKAGFYSRRASRPVNPGELVVVRERQVVDGVTLPLQRGGAVSGRIVDAHGEPVDGLRVFVQRLRYSPDGIRGPSAGGVGDTTNDLGQFRVYGLEPGDYVVVAARGAGLGSFRFAGVDPSATVPTYYPGTADAAQAQVISINGGEQATVQFAVLEQRSVTVSGIARRSDGRPAAGMQVVLRSRDGANRFVGQVPETGAFSIPRVAAGHYFVDVYTVQGFSGPITGLRPVTAPRERGSRAISVGAEDVPDVAVVTSPGATVSGTVVFERPFAGSAFQISATPADTSSAPGAGAASNVVGEDGRFSIAGVADRTFLSAVNQWWTITSVTANGRDIGEEPLDLANQPRLSGLQITVTDRLTEVSGNALDENKEPLGDHHVVILRLDGLSLPISQRVRRLRTDERGAFTLRGLRPGSYVAGVVAEIEDGGHFSPDFHERLRQHGRRFSLDEGEATTLQLRPTLGLP